MIEYLRIKFSQEELIELCNKSNVSTIKTIDLSKDISLVVSKHYGGGYLEEWNIINQTKTDLGDTVYLIRNPQVFLDHFIKVIGQIEITKNDINKIYIMEYDKFKVYQIFTDHLIFFLSAKTIKIPNERSIILNKEKRLYVITSINSYTRGTIGKAYITPTLNYPNRIRNFINWWIKREKKKGTIKKNIVVSEIWTKKETEAKPDDWAKIVHTPLRQNLSNKAKINEYLNYLKKELKKETVIYKKVRIQEAITHLSKPIELNITKDDITEYLKQYPKEIEVIK